MWCWLATSLYTLEAIRFSFFSNGISSRIPLLLRFIYIATNLFFCPIAIIFGPMIMMNLFQAFNNLTPVENLSGYEKRAPCFWPDPNKFRFSYQNKFNMLWMNNMASVFGDSIVEWVLPT